MSLGKSKRVSKKSERSREILFWLEVWKMKNPSSRRFEKSERFFRILPYFHHYPTKLCVNYEDFVCLFIYLIYKPYSSPWARGLTNSWILWRSWMAWRKKKMLLSCEGSFAWAWTGLLGTWWALRVVARYGQEKRWVMVSRFDEQKCKQKKNSPTVLSNERDLERETAG